jgi:hypothetical protein
MLMFHLNYEGAADYSNSEGQRCLSLLSFTIRLRHIFDSSLCYTRNAIDNYAKHNGVRGAGVSCHHRFDRSQHRKPHQQLAQDGSAVAGDTNFLEVAIRDNASPLKIVFNLVYLKTGA